MWLGDGIEGDDTDGHVDDLARFVDARTIVIGIEDDAGDANYRVLRENRRRLALRARSQGRPFDDRRAADAAAGELRRASACRPPT